MVAKDALHYPEAEIPPVVEDPFADALDDSVPTAMRVTEKEGQPLVRRVPALTKTDVEDMLMVMLSKPLEVNIEALKDAPLIQQVFHTMGLKAVGGNEDMIKEVLNRVLGKPQQKVKSLNVSTGLEEYTKYLESLSDNEQ